MSKNRGDAMLLHIVNKSPFVAKTLDSCLRLATKGAPILLIEDAVYAVKSGTAQESTLKSVIKEHPVYALSEDLKARGIDGLIDGVKVIDYSGFVDLVEEHISCSWI